MKCTRWKKINQDIIIQTEIKKGKKRKNNWDFEVS